MSDDIKDRSLTYLYRHLKKARIALGKTEVKPNSGNEVVGLKNKIEVLEWLTDIALNARKGE